MRKNHPSKTVLVERVIIAWALLATAAYFVQKATVNYTFDYSFLSHPAYESRFEDLAQTLPALGKAYYIADPEADRSSETALIRELLARYCLAPYLSPDAESPFQVSDFHHPIDMQQWAQAHHMDLVRDFENGVALLKKKGFR
jgi:hypothetical protein